jgi:Domain of unknown function (DUF2427)
VVGPILRDAVTATARHPRPSSLFPHTFCLRRLRLMGRHTHSMLLLSLFALNAARAHEHDDELSEEVANAAIDSMLWIHIFLQAAVWGILFPIGMVFGISRSRWHVPLQVCPHLRPRLPLPLHLTSPFSPLYLSYCSSTGSLPHWRILFASYCRLQGSHSR